MTRDEYRELLKTVETAHGRFTYLDVGEGPVALFVHGLFMSAFMWTPVIDQLAGERRCVAFNLPAHGGSSVPEEQPLTLGANADMLEGFCDALGLRAIDLVANDTGGAIAQALVVRDPGRISTLTLTNCEANDWMPSKAPLGQLVKQMAASGDLAPLLKQFCDDRDNLRESAFSSTLQWPERPSDDEALAIMEPHQSTLEAARRLERFASSLEADDLVALEPRLRALEVPAIAVWGTGDELFPLSLAHWLRDTIPGLDEVVEVDGGKLFWPFERPGELVPHLRRHWATASAAPPQARAHG